jgi:hypothetical protein
MKRWMENGGINGKQNIGYKSARRLVYETNS